MELVSEESVIKGAIPSCFIDGTLLLTEKLNNVDSGSNILKTISMDDSTHMFPDYKLHLPAIIILHVFLGHGIKVFYGHPWLFHPLLFPPNLSPLHPSLLPNRWFNLHVLQQSIFQSKPPYETRTNLPMKFLKLVYEGNQKLPRTTYHYTS